MWRVVGCHPAVGGGGTVVRRTNPCTATNQFYDSRVVALMAQTSRRSVTAGDSDGRIGIKLQGKLLLARGSNAQQAVSLPALGHQYGPKHSLARYCAAFSLQFAFCVYEGYQPQAACGRTILECILRRGWYGAVVLVLFQCVCFQVLDDVIVSLRDAFKIPKYHQRNGCMPQKDFTFNTSLVPCLLTHRAGL